MRSAFVALALLGAAFAFPGAGAVTASVSIQGFAFSPNPLTVTVGDTVTWTNLDGAPHTATSNAGAPAAFNTGSLPTGQSESHTFTVAGTYGYHCAIHPSMTATLTVQGAPQNAAPSVAFINPAEGATVSGTVTVSGTASDADGDALTVTLAIDDGASVAVTGTHAWSYAWNTTALADGSHTLRVMASDGQATASATRTIQIARPSPNRAPIVTITAPAESAEVTGLVEIRGTASDPDGDAVTVRLRIDDAAPAIVNGSTSWSFSWDVSGLAEGPHTLLALVDDGRASATSETRTVTVRAAPAPPNRPPSIAFLSPAEGSHVSGVVDVLGFSSDPDGTPIVVRIQVDDDTPRTVSHGHWTYTWDTRGLAPGLHRLTAVAEDGTFATRATLTVEVVAERANRPPTIRFTSHENGTIVSGLVTLLGEAVDPDGEEPNYSLNVDDRPWVSLGSGAMFTYTWNTTLEVPGQHAITVRADDAQGGVAMAFLTVVVEEPGIVVVQAPPGPTATPGLGIVLAAVALLAVAGFRRRV